MPFRRLAEADRAGRRTRWAATLALTLPLLSCQSDDAPPKVPEAGGDLVYSVSGRAFECQAEDEPCVPAPPPGQLKARCMDADHSIRLCNCEWVCSGPM
jgi:hypothetical protein